MTTAIERLWKQEFNNPNEKRVNGDLLDQAKYICGHCGHETERHSDQCIHCGAEIA